MGDDAAEGAQRGTGSAGSADSAGAGTGGPAGVPEGITPLDDGAVSRYAAARQATAARKGTYKAGTVGDVLAPGPNGQPYRVGDAEVADRFWTQSNRGPRAIENYTKAVGGEPQAMALLTDYAAFSFRRSVTRPDGSVDPRKAAAWLKAHDEALNAFPELRRRFRDAASAEETLANVIKSRAAAEKQVDIQLLRRLTNSDDPVQFIGRALSGSNGADTIGRLATRVAGNAEGEAALRRAVVDWMRGRFEGFRLAGNTGEGTLNADQLRRFVRDHRDALSKVPGWDAEQMKVIDGIVTEMREAAMASQSARLPAGSNTAQDVAAGSALYGEQSILGRLLHRSTEAGAGAAGLASGGIAGAAAGWLGAHAINAMRDAGLRTIDDLVERMLLHPQFAKTMLEKYPAELPAAARTRVINGLRSVVPAVVARELASTRRTREDRQSSPRGRAFTL